MVLSQEIRKGGFTLEQFRVRTNFEFDSPMRNLEKYLFLYHVWFKVEGITLFSPVTYHFF
jgi:hypothetical protein